MNDIDPLPRQTCLNALVLLAHDGLGHGENDRAPDRPPQGFFFLLDQGERPTPMVASSVVAAWGSGPGRPKIPG